MKINSYIRRFVERLRYENREDAIGELSWIFKTDVSKLDLDKSEVKIHEDGSLELTKKVKKTTSKK